MHTHDNRNNQKELENIGDLSWWEEATLSRVIMWEGRKSWSENGTKVDFRGEAFSEHSESHMVMPLSF